ncbi:MAG TPA: VOC family protein [Candidatus Acidoferrum sp.]|nr:VOC family protein [Candidatus Acidoferrum sp.]
MSGDGSEKPVEHRGPMVRLERKQRITESTEREMSHRRKAKGRAMRIRMMVACGVVLMSLWAVGVPARQQQGDKPAAQGETAAPKPGPEMEKLKFLLGKWNATVTYEKTPLFPQGGEARGPYTAKLGPGGFSVIADFEGTGGPEGAFQGHEIITWDPQENGYKRYTFGNSFPGAFVSNGHWEGQKLVFEGDLEFGGAKFHFRNELTREAGGAVTIKESYKTGDAPTMLMATTRAIKGGSMGRPVVHFEIGGRDIAKTQEFYAKLFDWKITPMGPAAMIDTGEGIPGHITALGHEPNHYTIFYVDVDDVAAYLEKVKGLGGKTLVPPVEIPTGTFAWFMDPEGNTIGLWKSKK